MHVLEKLVNNSQAAIDNGTYEIRESIPPGGTNLVRAIRASRHAAIVAEVKFSSPSLGKIRTRSDPASVAAEMIRGGAVALSVLTQPYLFGGSPQYFMRVRRTVDVPMLMKDIIVDRVQIDAAQRMGADYILLISSMFEYGYLHDVAEYIGYAHKKGLRVLLEVHTANEMRQALKADADLIGINNRDLDTLEVDLATTEGILASVATDRLVLSESGIRAPGDIRRLRAAGAAAFLVGSSIMGSDDISGYVRELVNAY